MMRTIVKCPDCGRLFAHQPGKKYCVDCLLMRERNQAAIEEAVERHDKRTPGEIARFTKLPLDQVAGIIEDSPSLRRLVDMRARCAKCHVRPAQKGSDFCLHCRLELYKSFGDATDELFTQVEMLEPRPYAPEGSTGSVMGIVSTLEQKRARTGASRFNPAPRNRIR